MGGAASTLKNDKLDLQTLKQLAGPRFSEDIYNTYKLPDGTFPRSKFIELCQLTDLFLTHNWGQGMMNHQRVSAINERLKDSGYITWFDSDRMQGNIVDQMTAGIDNAQLVVVFITKDYIEKVAQIFNPNDNCKIEFQYAVRRKTSRNMIAVVMDSDMRNTNDWSGPVGAALGGELYIDFSDDDRLEENMKLLETEVKSRISPYGTMKVGDAGAADNEEIASPTSLDALCQELVAWMISEVHFSPPYAQKYAQIFTKNNVNSVEKLRRKLAKNPALLHSYEMDDDDAEDILRAIRSSGSATSHAAAPHAERRGSSSAHEKKDSDPAPPLKTAAAALSGSRRLEMEELRGYDYTIKQFLSEGFELSELRSMDFFKVDEYFKADCKPIEMLDAGFPMAELKAKVRQMQSTTRSDVWLHAITTVKVCTPRDMEAADAKGLPNKFWQSLMDKGYDVAELKEAGCSGKLLREIGVDIAVLKRLGFKRNEIYKVSEMKDNKLPSQLLKMGFSVKEMLEPGGYSMLELVDDPSISLSSYSDSKIGIDELLAAGIVRDKCKNAEVKALFRVVPTSSSSSTAQESLKWDQAWVSTCVGSSLSDSDSTVSWSDSNNFKPLCATKSFSSGRHSWDIQVTDQSIIFGIALPTVAKKSWLGSAKSDPTVYAFTPYKVMSDQSPNSLHLIPPQNFGKNKIYTLLLDADADFFSIAVKGEPEIAAITFVGGIKGKTWVPVVGGNSSSSKATLLSSASGTSSSSSISSSGVAALQWDSTWLSTCANAILQDDNKTISFQNGINNFKPMCATQSYSSGRHVWKIKNIGKSIKLGICKPNVNKLNWMGSDPSTVRFFTPDTSLSKSSSVHFLPTYVKDEELTFILDFDADTFSIARNGSVLQDLVFRGGIKGSTWLPAVGANSFECKATFLGGEGAWQWDSTWLSTCVKAILKDNNKTVSYEEGYNNYKPLCATQSFSSGVHTWKIRKIGFEIILGICKTNVQKSTWLGSDRAAVKAFTPYEGIQTQSSTALYLIPSRVMDEELTFILDFDADTFSIARNGSVLQDLVFRGGIKGSTWLPVVGANSFECKATFLS